MIVNFNSPFVFWTKVKNHDQIKEVLIPHIRSRIPEYQCYPNCFSSYYSQSYNFFTEQILRDIVWDPLDKMYTEKKLPLPESNTLDGLWWNYYTPGGYAKIHNHPSADWSGIYLLHLENHEDATEFYFSYGLSPNSKYLNEWKKMNMLSEGCVMIYPSILMHSLEPCVNDRSIIAFDIISNYGRPTLNFE